MLMDKLMIWGDKKTAANLNAGWNTIVDLGLGTGLKSRGKPVAITFKSAVAALAGGTSVAFTISSGDDTAAADTDHMVITLTTAQMNAGVTYFLPTNTDTYVKITAAAATGTYTGSGCLSVYLVETPEAPY